MNRAYSTRLRSVEFSRVCPTHPIYCSSPAAELEDFRLLIKLSYASSYIKDGDMPLDRATLIRLASLANAYEFHDTVNECLSAAGEGLSFEEAITCINDLPENLKGTDAAKGLMIKALQALVKGLNDPSSIEGMEEGEVKEGVLEKGADALARYIGPVYMLFREPYLTKLWPSFSGTLIPKDFVKVSIAFIFFLFSLYSSSVLQPLGSSSYIVAHHHLAQSNILSTDRVCLKRPLQGFFKVMLFNSMAKRTPTSF